MPVGNERFAPESTWITPLWTVTSPKVSVAPGSTSKKPSLLTVRVGGSPICPPVLVTTADS